MPSIWRRLWGILLAPMGYNPRGWCGIPPGPPRRGGPPPSATGAARVIQPCAPGAPARRPRAPTIRRMRRLSEGDARVVDLCAGVQRRRQRTYDGPLDGRRRHYTWPSSTRAVGGHCRTAPAAFSLQASSQCHPKMPVMVVHGDMDTAVPVSLSRAGSGHEGLEDAEVSRFRRGPRSVISSHQAGSSRSSAVLKSSALNDSAADQTDVRREAADG